MSFKRYRNTTLSKHLGNPLGSIRMQKHHLVETRRPRTPTKLPHLGYKARVFERVESKLKFDFNLAKVPYKWEKGGIYNPSSLLQLGQSQGLAKTKDKVILN